MFGPEIETQAGPTLTVEIIQQIQMPDCVSTVYENRAFRARVLRLPLPIQDGLLVVATNIHARPLDVIAPVDGQ